jgi:hypothetical protein
LPVTQVLVKPVDLGISGCRCRDDQGRRWVDLQQRRYVFRQTPNAGWPMADIVHPQEPSFRLTTDLRMLLEDQR